ncbi:NTP transferase domain-containing protein [Patescibacteria group bacterium]|nr:NTP transferase domain-containing protein [Patescibacteria group bacterium]
MLHNTQIIILAGGKGKRMGGEIPKALIPLNNRPIISYLLDSVKNCDFEIKPLVVIGFRDDLVQAELGDIVNYALQEKQLGTGHAVLRAKQMVDAATENIIVLYGDMPNTKTETIKKLLEIHNNESPAITMMTTKVPDFENEHSGFLGFGRVVRDEFGNIKKIVEIRDASMEEKNITELNPSLFCFNANWLWENLPKINNNNAQGEFYLPDMVGLAIEQGQKISSLQINPMECIGINTVEELRRAEGVVQISN